MASGGGVEQELRVDDVLVAIGIEREDAHAGAKFEIDYVNGAADANNQVAGTERVGDGGKDDALLQVELRARRIEQRLHVGENRPQRVLDIVSRDACSLLNVSPTRSSRSARRRSIRRAIAEWSAVPLSA